MRHHEQPLAPATVTQLLPLSGAAAHARNAVTEACLVWQLPHLLEAAALIASELVTNVVEHAHTLMELEVGLCYPNLQIRVHDGSTAPPIPSLEPTPEMQTGRGLIVVEAFSNAWGHYAHEGGKVVWASLVTDLPSSQ